MGYMCGFNSVDSRLMKDYAMDTNFYDYMHKQEDAIKTCLEKKSDFNVVVNNPDSPTNLTYTIPYDELREKYKEDVYGEIIATKEIDYWCSAGRYLTDFLKDVGITSDDMDGVVFLTQKEIINILAALCDKIIGAENIKRYDIEYGMKLDCGDEEASYQLIPIDGVELRNADTGEYQKVYVSDDEDDLTYIDMSLDIDGVYTGTIKCLCTILQTVDFNTEMVYFWESY